MSLAVPKSAALSLDHLTKYIDQVTIHSTVLQPQNLETSHREWAMH